MGFLSLIGGISGAFVYTQKQAKDHGIKECQLAQSNAAAQSLIQAQKDMVDIYHDLQNYESEIANTPIDNIRPSDDLLKSHYRMRLEQLRTGRGSAD